MERLNISFPLINRTFRRLPLLGLGWIGIVYRRFMDYVIATIASGPAVTRIVLCTLVRKPAKRKAEKQTRMNTDFEAGKGEKLKTEAEIYDCE